ncbi:MAG: NADH-quinone oxidoreductase subunit J [Candidatus Thermoplasmatota archaeon]
MSYLKGFVVFCFFVITFSLLTSIYWPEEIPNENKVGRMTDVGKKMFNEFSPVFILLSFILFIAMVGGVFLAREED